MLLKQTDALRSKNEVDQESCCCSPVYYSVEYSVHEDNDRVWPPSSLLTRCHPNFLETYTPKTSLVSVGLCGTPKAWNYTWERVEGVGESILLLHTRTELQKKMSPIIFKYLENFGKFYLIKNSSVKKNTRKCCISRNCSQSRYLALIHACLWYRFQELVIRKVVLWFSIWSVSQLTNQNAEL